MRGGRFVGQCPKHLLVVLSQDKALIHQFVLAGQGVTQDFFGDGRQGLIRDRMPGLGRGRSRDQAQLIEGSCPAALGISARQVSLTVFDISF
ncbi:MAG: hypothetical protein HC875_39240 [Anaerolineales bacterium]|nr:hypothetical protein [Anaerolineales bacterium]